MLQRILKSAPRAPWRSLLAATSSKPIHTGSPGSASSLNLLQLTRRRALALFLLTGSTLSFAAYRLREIHLDSDGSEQARRARWLKGPALLEAFDPDSILRQRSESIAPSLSSGLRRFDFAQIASNEPIEDYHSELFVPTGLKGSYWSFFAILDGHAGFQTAEWLSDHLLPSVSRALRRLDEPTSSDSSSTARDEAIASTFLQLDREIVDDAVSKALEDPSTFNALKTLDRANAGSCALVAFFDSESRTLKVANTGDSRAILGRRTTTADGRVEYEVKELSFDHNGYNEREVERLSALHPDEDLFANGRYIGWGCARAFGDGRTKWSKEIQDELKTRYLGRSPSKTLKTPPYFTAEPEITTTKIEKGDFLIMATDGLWESLSNEEVVGIVGKWLQSREDPSLISHASSAKPSPKKGTESPSIPSAPPPSPTPGSTSDNDNALPVRLPEKDDTIRYRQWGRPKRFAFVKGDTSAECLVRNALGGADEDLRAALLSMRNPMSRSFRDDISVTVVHF